MALHSLCTVSLPHAIVGPLSHALIGHDFQLCSQTASSTSLLHFMFQPCITFHCSAKPRLSSCSHFTGNQTTGFVEAYGVGVCRGKYSRSFTSAWKAWDAKHGSENDPPHKLPVSQLFVVFIVADGGNDLEHGTIASFDQARSMLLQVRGRWVACQPCGS